ncbi:hypothetical protein GA0070607_6451 [Micromonospora coriariae]|uniref:Uncharacterized protein n=1 Tax=Micromonospora coriariae TaxID=285665 RepID=A0A1C4Y9J9_9ACTN|nr:hypothetical protein [Micromonospora coriariae]SCF17316.1 hypothetical protein GA0070607_6451 [Micromonospora coriariae]
MPKKKMWVEYDDGSHLSKSQKKPGEYSPLTREDATNKLGHVTLSDIDDDDDEEEEEEEPPMVYGYTTDSSEPDRPPAPAEPLLSEREMEMLGALLILGATAVGRAKPQVTKWLAEQAVPAVRSTWNRLRSREPDRAATRAEQTAAAEAAPSTETQDVVAAIEAYRASMSTEEARNRFLAALVTRLYSEDQLRMLREARIEDVDGLLELDGMVEPLTAEQLRSAIRALLDEDAFLVGDGAQAELGKILGTNRPEAARVPLAGAPSTGPLRTARGL